MSTPAPFLERPVEADYVQLFQEFARVQMKIHDQGPRPELLLRRAWIELAMGDYPAADASAQAVLDANTRHAEAGFVRAEAWFRHVLASHGITHWTPGHAIPPLNGAREHLQDARDAFAALMATDEDARDRVDALDAVLASVADGRAVADALADLTR